METIQKRIQFLINTYYSRNVSALARDAGIKRPTISNILKRESNPSLELAVKIFKVFENENISARWFFLGEGPLIADENMTFYNQDEKDLRMASSPKASYNKDSSTHPSNDINQTIDEIKKTIPDKDRIIEFLTQEIESMKKGNI